MFRALMSAWPIFIGLTLMMIANGLMGTLLGVRASIEGFNTAAIGLIMSMYYLGFLGGSYYVPKLISAVGHIRVFTALASLASITVLLHGLYPEPVLWALARLCTGIGFAGLYIVVESWINDIATNKTRGKLLGLYSLVSYCGLVLGQLFMNFAPPENIELFIMTSVLVSLALIPISLSSRPAPEFAEPDPISLKALFKISPLGMMGAFGCGTASAILMGLGAVYATSIGMSVAQVSGFMASYLFGGVLFQMVVGWFSDRYDRRLVIIAVCLLSAIFAGLCFLASQNPWLLNVFFFFLGGMSLTIYGQCAAYTTDHLEPRQYVSAVSALILVNGMGAALGPFLVSIGMETVGDFIFFPIVAAIFLTLAIYGFYRTFQRAAVPQKDQGDSMLMPESPSPIMMAITEEGSEAMKELQNEDEKKS